MDTLDLICPPRPAMPKVTREIFNSSRYCVTLTRAGLIVQSHRTGKGSLLPIGHPQYADYVKGIETAIDTDEVELLCKALL